MTTPMKKPALTDWLPDEPRIAPERGKCGLDRRRRGRRGQRVQSFELGGDGFTASLERVQDGLVFRRDGTGVVLEFQNLRVECFHVGGQPGNGAVHAVIERILLRSVFYDCGVCHTICSFGCAPCEAVYCAGVLASKASSFRATRPERASSVSRIFWSSGEGVQPACNRASIAFKSQRVTRCATPAACCTASVSAQTASVKCFTSLSSSFDTSGQWLSNPFLSISNNPHTKTT